MSLKEKIKVIRSVKPKLGLAPVILKAFPVPFF